MGGYLLEGFEELIVKMDSSGNSNNILSYIRGVFTMNSLLKMSTWHPCSLHFGLFIQRDDNKP
jgi:hypothetical protein